MIDTIDTIDTDTQTYTNTNECSILPSPNETIPCFKEGKTITVQYNFFVEDETKLRNAYRKLGITAPFNADEDDVKLLVEDIVLNLDAIAIKYESDPVLDFNDIGLSLLDTYSKELPSTLD